MKGLPSQRPSTPIQRSSSQYYKSETLTRNIRDTLDYLENYFITLLNDDHSSLNFPSDKALFFAGITKIYKIADPNLVFNKLANRYLREIAKHNYSSKQLNCGHVFSYKELINTETAAAQTSSKSLQSKPEIKKINLGFYASLSDLFDQEATKAFENSYSQSLLPKKIAKTDLFQNYPILNSNNHNKYFMFRISQLFEKNLAGASGAYREYLENLKDLISKSYPDDSQPQTPENKIFNRDYKILAQSEARGSIVNDTKTYTYADLLKKINKLNAELIMIKKGLKPTSEIKNIESILKSFESSFTLSSEDFSSLSLSASPIKPSIRRDIFLDSPPITQPSKPAAASPNRVKEAKKTYSDTYFRASMAYKEAWGNLSSIISQMNCAASPPPRKSPQTPIKISPAAVRSLT